MPLQSDPTVIYGLKDFNGNLTRKDLYASSPYNTYRIPALPPGPICNPGLSSLRAALHPASVPFLYFVSKNDGTHHFLGKPGVAQPGSQNLSAAQRNSSIASQTRYARLAMHLWRLANML